MNKKEVFSFDMMGEYTPYGIKNAVSEFGYDGRRPIIVCVGSDLVLGDSLGPLVGTFLKQKGAGAYVYGTLNYPVTAKEVEYAQVYLKKIHPDAVIIAIDAAIGQDEDVGLIKVAPFGLKPGAGVDKNLSAIGDVSIVGVVASKSVKNKNLFSYTRLNLVYRMANVISEGIIKYLESGKRFKTTDVVC
ncbi:MAG: spore protease YyaC [Clostridia bacterium]|nr:spore protease YyaC [Clostridia bacterium]